MAHDGQDLSQTALLAHAPALLDQILPALADVQARATGAVRALVEVNGKVNAALIDQHQRAVHGLAWVATYAESLRQMSAWAGRLQSAGQFGEMEALILQIGAGEYLAQLAGGIPMNQGEILRLSDLGLAVDFAPMATLMQGGNTPAARARLVALMRDNAGRATFGATGLDEELEMIRDQFRRFADEEVAPHAHEWDLKDELIPMEII